MLLSKSDEFTRSYLIFLGKQRGLTAHFLRDMIHDFDDLKRAYDQALTDETLRAVFKKAKAIYQTYWTGFNVGKMPVGLDGRPKRFLEEAIRMKTDELLTMKMTQGIEGLEILRDELDSSLRPTFLQSSDFESYVIRTNSAGLQMAKVCGCLCVDMCLCCNGCAGAYRAR